MSDCNKGDHDLVIITSLSVDPISDKVVRWCKQCGAIVGDIDCDNRTMQPGGWFKMSLPNNAQKRECTSDDLTMSTFRRT